MAKKEEEIGYIGAAKEKMSHARDITKDFVEGHPWKTAVIAAAVGAIVAVGISSMRGRRHKEESLLDRLLSLI
mgnify:CR=1 FL=1